MKGNAKIVKTISVIMLILAGMIWGGSFVVVKDSLDYITPLWQLALRLLVASVPAAVLAVINLNKWDRKSICHGAVLGVIFAAALIFQNKGMQYVSASKSAFLTGTYVAFLPVIEIVFLRRRVAARKSSRPSYAPSVQQCLLYRDASCRSGAICRCLRVVHFMPYILYILTRICQSILYFCTQVR